MTRPVCRIVADIFERRSGVAEVLDRRGVDIEFGRLAAGDYDLGNGVVVERKTVRDLHGSIQSGRLWQQVGRLRRCCRLPYLLVEGTSLYEGPVPREAIRGVCLAVLGQGVPIVPSDGASDSACWLHLLALRVQGIRPGRDRPVYAQRLKTPEAQVGEAMLAVVPGISVMHARALLRRFGTVSAVVEAGYDAWTSVPGIGPRRAGALKRAIT